jgi:predicted outer membrane repeat protein
MYNASGNPTFRQCTFTANWAGSRAGGMYNTGSSPTLIDCTFSENTTGGGGALAGKPVRSAKRLSGLSAPV